MQMFEKDFAFHEPQAEPEQLTQAATMISPRMPEAKVGPKASYWRRKLCGLMCQNGRTY